MDATFERYLDTVDQYLKPVPASERADIIKEIKGSILEMESDNFTAEQILNRLGSRKILRKHILATCFRKKAVLAGADF